MRLLNITNRYYLVTSVVLLLVSSAFLSYRVFYVVDKEIAEHMLIKKSRIEEQIASQPFLQDRPFQFGDLVEVTPIERFTSFRVYLKDTALYDAYEEDLVPFRVLSYEQQINKKAYRIRIWDRGTQNKELWRGMVYTILLVGIDIVALFYFLNRFFSTRIWRPFYQAIAMLQRFDVQRNSKLRFLFSNVDEFNTLNNELIRLTDKVTRDYRNLREFTENMSHETQTPLAIIRSKLEIIMQSDNLTPEQMNQVRSALDSVNRLSKMNRGLILLTRIENEQYAEEQHVPLGKLIRKQLGDLDMFIESRELKVRDEIDERVFLLMNPYLADILITNLLSNAIKYNKEGGELLVRLTASELVVGNSGDPLPIPGSQIFERFKKGNQADSVGLDLAIVKRICDHSELEVHYDYLDDRHLFILRFSAERVFQSDRA